MNLNAFKLVQSNSNTKSFYTPLLNVCVCSSPCNEYLLIMIYI